MRDILVDIKDLQLNALLEVTQAVNNNLPENDLLKIYRFTLLADLKINKLALFTEENGKWSCRVNFGTDINYIKIDLPEEYCQLEKEKKVSDVLFPQFDTVFPIYHKNKLIAVVFIEDSTSHESQNRFLNALTNIILVAIENKKLARHQMEQTAYQKELEIATKVQQFLFPKELPKTDRLQIEAFYLPHHDIGGDYYDYILISENRFLVCIADVSGKGVPAALLMSNFQASLRALVRQTQNLKEIVNELNHITYISGNAENFITFYIAIYDFQSKKMEYINCGHNEIILKQESGLKMLKEGTTVLGVFNPLPFIVSKEIENLTNFFLFAYTDGLTETFNEKDEAFEFDRLKYLLQEDQTKSLSDLHHNIFGVLNDFRGDCPFHDDITMLSCKVNNK